MSNFLRNLARRSAGLPLAAECRPTPAPGFAGSFDSGVGLSEIAAEETAGSQVEAPLAGQIQTPLSSATPQVQRSLAKRTGTSATAMAALRPNVPSAADATTAWQPFSSPEAVSTDQPASLMRADATAMTAPAEIGSRDLRFNSRAASAPAQTPLSPRTDLAATIDPPATTLRHSEGNKSVWPEVSVQEPAETIEQKHGPPTSEQLIRPAATDPTLPFQFPRTATASSQPAAAAPIEVRIARVEVRGAPPVQAPAPAAPPPSPPLGFASYNRLRRYRN